MAKPNFETFLDLVQRSGLIDKDRLESAIAQFPKDAGGNTLTDVERAAEHLISLGLITRWHSEKLLEGRHRGFFLGRYKLLDMVAAGGMSTVYLAEHVLMQRRVAIKVLPKQRVTDTSYLARFHREAQAAASLDHQNIVRAYDVDNEGDIHYLVMEYVEGRDLQRLVKQEGRMGYVMAADYIRQAAEGLSHAHAAALIHRDVKPANLLVDPKGVLKVLDLGLARFTDESQASLTVQFDENVLGTADYLAPEQAIDSHGVDARADIYSLGCSLYYLLTGHPPFPDGTLPQRLMAHQRTPPPSILIDRPDCPSDLIEICLKMMAKKAADRYQSMNEVALALQRWLKDYNSGSGSGVRSGSGSSSPGYGVTSPSSSGRMAALSSGTPPAGVATVAQRLPAGTGRRESKEVPRTAAVLPTRSLSLTDTLSSADPESRTPLPGRMAATDWQTVSDKDGPRSRDKAPLPMARPLEEPFSLPAKPGSVDFNDFLGGSPQTRSSSMAVNGRPHVKRPKGFNPPKWIWLAIGGMCILGVILVIVLLYLPASRPAPAVEPLKKDTGAVAVTGSKSSASPSKLSDPSNPFPDAPGSTIRPK